VFFAQRVLHNMAGKWTFVFVIEPLELDNQIVMPFEVAGAVSEAEIWRLFRLVGSATGPT
jgi:hypothetical protein